MTLKGQNVDFEKVVAEQLLENGAISVVKVSKGKVSTTGQFDLIAMFKDSVWLVKCKRHGLVTNNEKIAGFQLGSSLQNYAHTMLAYYRGGVFFTEFKDFNLSDVNKCSGLTVNVAMKNFR